MHTSFSCCCFTKTKNKKKTKSKEEAEKKELPCSIVQRNDVEIEGKVSFKLFFRFLFRVVGPAGIFFNFFFYDYILSIRRVFLFSLVFLFINKQILLAGRHSAYIYFKWVLLVGWLVHATEVDGSRSGTAAADVHVDEIFVGKYNTASINVSLTRLNRVTVYSKTEKGHSALQHENMHGNDAKTIE